MTRVATEFANAGFRYLFGNPVAPEQSSAPDTWMTRLLAQHRTGLGELLSIAPAVLERNSKLADSLTGRRVLYRAGGLTYDGREDDLLTPLAKEIRRFGGHCLVSETVVNALPAKPSPRDPDYAAVTEVAKDLLSAENRLDLPATLEELKHFARRNRHDALSEVIRRLKLQLKVELYAKGITLIDEMRDVLGQNCFAEILRLGMEQSYLNPECKDPTAYDKVEVRYQALMGKLGFLSKEKDKAHLSILTARSAPHRSQNRYFTYFILDHRRDVVYEIRGALRNTAFTEIELYGPAEGRNYNVEHDVPDVGNDVTAFGDDVTAVGDDVHGCQFRLPFRVADASQAFATWSVDRRLIQDELDHWDRGRTMSRPKLRAADLGADRTLLVLSFIDYRDSDLKEPAYELLLGALVAPEDDPLAMGLFPLATIVVSSEENVDLGKKAWGFPKECAAQDRSQPPGTGSWLVKYRPSELSCTVTLPTSPSPSIDVTFPRGGDAASPPVPLAWYTHKNGHWHRSILTRSGTGESVRIGRSGFSLSIRDFPSPPIAAEPRSIPDWLYFAGIVDDKGTCVRPPMNTGWTEHFTASISPAVLLPRPTREAT